ncbi:MAG: epimerase [Chloroflexi bacterium]|nr:MAG: epimerase [Chloroflexota bacterium]
MKRILITGGRGVFGRELTPRLLKAGYTVRISSRSAPKTDGASNLEWVQMDLQQQSDLSAAVAEVDVIIHAASDPLHAHEVDVLGTERLLNAARTAGVSHFTYISIVGIDRMEFAYYGHKLAAEQRIEQGGVPWSILRATQFHSFIDRLLQPLQRLAWMPFYLLPTDFQSQPIDEGEVADHFVQIIKDGPGGRLPDIAGPEILTLGQMVKPWLAAQGLARPVWRLPVPGKAAAGFRRGRNTDLNARYGKITWGEWVAQHYGQRQQKPNSLTLNPR